MADPDVLLVDEVLGVGDAEFREKSARTIRERINSDRTVVLVSHNTKVIEQNCDRAVWIENGVVMAAGDTTTVVNRYLGSRNGARAARGAGQSAASEHDLAERGKLHRVQ
jgi:lipopolysaccharide transport system ATP-binding protein